MNGQVLAIIGEDKDARPFVTIKEPEGENRIPHDQHVDDEEAGKQLADRGVLNAYPHECGSPQCSEWQKFAGQ